jgi:adenylate cyclase
MAPLGHAVPLKVDFMADLLAIGPDPKDRFRKSLPEDTIVRIGRAPRSGWSVPWDRAISREHLDLQFTGGKLQVKCLGTARNPVVYGNESCYEFEMLPGEEFRIGRTVFRLLEARVESADAPPLAEHSFSTHVLRKVGFTDPGRKLEVLSRLPPLISEARTDSDLAKTIVELLLEAIPDAEVASVVCYSEAADPRQDEPVLLWWDSPSGLTLFRPSRRLLSRSLDLGESILHLWGDRTRPGESQWTMCGDLDWAFCVPVGGAPCAGWCIYVAGRSKTEADLRGDMRFAELLAEFIRSIRTVRVLERRYVQMGQFFSPAVVETLVTPEAERLLQPREQNVTVLFCDLRGFSQEVERSREDLHALLDRVSEALGVMTQNIMKYEGVIADFQGDAALGFWGWPSFSEDDPLSACRAALAMLAEFCQAHGAPEHPLAGFKVGIGICHGTAIAGKIGTSEQAKVGVFGPVVNLAARLQSLTRRVGVAILTDEAVASCIRKHLAPSEALCRRIARVCPIGIGSAVMVSELLPPLGGHTSLTMSHLVEYENALDAFIEGRWREAKDRLDGIPGEDGAKAFLTMLLAERQCQPPEDWDGVIRMHEK